VLLVFDVVVSERQRHEAVEEELVEQARLLESLVDAFRTIAAATEPDEVLERTRGEAERLFRAPATFEAPGERPEDGPVPDELVVALQARCRWQLGAIRLARDRPFGRDDMVRATLLGDFASRALENARLLEEARVREAERAHLSDQLITAEQDERRRLALFLHDTSVQSLSGIALMLDAGLSAVADGRIDEARRVLSGALERHRETIRELRDLSFQLEPVVLRDRGFAPAVEALAEQLALEHELRIETAVCDAEGLSEQAQAALYQIVREALQAAIRRGPECRLEVRVTTAADGKIEAVVSDDAPRERRRRAYDAIGERVRTLGGRLELEQGAERGTTVRVALPPYRLPGPE
jgi:signal transduction histidine kinase